LRLFGGGTASKRDLGLAYAIVGDRERARPLLEAALGDDPEVLVYLAGIDRSRAEELYRRALRLAPGDVSALVGLGAIVFERGDRAAAIRLWRDAAARNPGLVLTRTNLAMAQWQSGDRDGARVTLEQVIALSPAFQPAVDLLRRLGPNVGR
jgi:cytochrome c-type biogenesis protein CcmH/NrfG